MSGQTIGDIIKSKSKEVDPIVSEVSIFKQLIKERVHSLDLLRELISNSGAKEVGTSEIEISYTKDKDGHIFEISDDGCGMNYTGEKTIPGRLDKFFGLGLSGIIGQRSDEFSWKGLGSKLSYQSKRVEIETCEGDKQPFYDVRINEPWETIENNRIPRPRISEHPPQQRGTKIRVIGHPPHRQEEPFDITEIRKFLQHRTFVGFTRKRENSPTITLSVLGRTINIPFGFPEFKDIVFDEFAHEGLKLDTNRKTLFINMSPASSKTIRVKVKGFLTWEAEKFQLSHNNLNTGLILSVKGIPYFNLDMKEYGITTIRTARPGEGKTCLVVECDSIQDEMNISRSSLVDSPKTLDLKKVVTEIFQRIESSDEYLSFRRIPDKDKIEKQSDILENEKKQILSREQTWVVLEKEGENPIVLIREPRNEQDVNALIWKLEALEALPFEKFKTLAYIGAAKGPDILAKFQEEKGSEPSPAAVVEIENNFYNYKYHGHTPSQYPKVICWDIPSSGRKAKLNKTGKRFKYTQTEADFQVHVFVLKLMDGIRVMSTEELESKGISV